MTLDIHLLGPPRLFCDETPVPLRGHRPLALLAYLVVTGKAHTRTHLTDLLFTGSADPRAGLRWTLTKLRQATDPDFILANRDQVAFNDGAGHRCDVDALLAGDLDVVRGGFLEGLHVDQAPLFEEWQLVTAQQLRQTYQDGLLSRIARHELRGEHETVVALAARLVQMDNLREEWRRTLMRAYAGLGQWDAANEQFEQCRQLLHDELATAPSRETIALWHQVRRREPPATSTRASGPRHSDQDRRADGLAADGAGQPAQLPFFRTSFIGREAELQDIQATLADPGCRLLTVVGPGGIGKTRLAVQAAMNLERRFEAGIHFVPLRQVTTAAAMAPAIARSLGLTIYGDEGLRTQLLTYLRRRSVLLVLDNMEHLLATSDWHEGEALLAEILAGAAGVRFLATSRERLHMPEEWLCLLEGLGFPAEADGSSSDLLGYPAVQLFLQRARQIDAAYHPDRVDADQLGSIVAICQRTEGMPLALEMAAAWVHHMPCAAIADALDRDLTILATPDDQGPPRHASMHAVFEHSWQLLTPELQQLLARLAVISGRFDREAAAAVSGGSLFALSTLLDKSLLEATGDGRYQVHELLRQFAAEKLATDVALASATKELQSIYYCDFCYRQEQDLKGGDQISAAQRLEEALGNLRVAFAWAVDRGEWTRVADASFSLGHFCCQHGRVEEGRAIFAEVIDAPGRSELSAAQALAQARASYWLGRLAEGRNAIPFWRQAISSLRLAERSGLGTDFDAALFEEALASAAELEGDNAGAECHYQAGLTAARLGDDPWAEARILNAYAELQVWTLARYSAALQNAEAALRLQRAIHDRSGMIETLGTLCVIATFFRNYARAIQISEEQLAISLTMGNDLRVASAHRDVGWSLLLAGRFDECLAQLRHAYALYTHYGRDRLAAETLYGLSWRSCMGGHYDEAFHYAAELQARLVDKEGYRNVRDVLLYVQSQLAFHDGRYAEARELARESSENLAKTGSHNQWALALITLGFANLAHDDVAGAAKQARTLMGMGASVGLWGLGIAALVLVRQEPCEERYVEFYELLALQRSAAPMCDSPSFREIIQRLQPPAIMALPEDLRNAAEARGRALDPDRTITALNVMFSNGDENGDEDGDENENEDEDDSRGEGRSLRSGQVDGSHGRRRGALREAGGG